MNFTALDNYLNKEKNTCLPGTDCKIYYKHKPVYRHITGFMDTDTKEPLKPEAKYFIFSGTKPITCTAALTLYEKSEFMLSDNLYEYIPEFKDMYIKVYNSDGSYNIKKSEKPIKIIDLFTMSAGFSYNIEYDSIKRIQKETNGECPTLQLIKELAKEPLEFEPGTHFNYSLCHDILGGLIEVISGKSLGEFLKAVIFDPIGMNNTSFTVSEEEYQNMPSLYHEGVPVGNTRKIQKSNMFKLGSKYESGGAGLISTTDDYSAFAECLCKNGFTKNGDNIISKATIDLMRTNHLDAVRLADFHSNNALHRIGYGYGLGVRTMIDRVQGGINGSTGDFGWPGAAGSYSLIDPQKELAVVFLQHTMGMNTLWTVHPRLRNIIYACLDK